MISAPPASRLGPRRGLGLRSGRLCACLARRLLLRGRARCSLSRRLPLLQAEGGRRLLLRGRFCPLPLEQPSTGQTLRKAKDLSGLGQALVRLRGLLRSDLGSDRIVVSELEMPIRLAHPG